MSVTFAEERDTVRKTEYKVNNNRGYLIVKRAFDVVASAVALVVLFIPMAIVGLLVWIESPGPVIYKQERLGKDGEIFVMYKFRSMRLDSEKNGPQWASKNDDRCTKVGRFIRLFHIDELPQLLNVLKGEMSVVGPRPEREYFYQEFEKIVPDFRVRLLVKPGLTGWAQINGRDELEIDVKARFDGEYAAALNEGKFKGFAMDVKCFFGTIRSVLSSDGVVEGGTGEMKKAETKKSSEDKEEVRK